MAPGGTTGVGGGIAPVGCAACAPRSRDGAADADVGRDPLFYHDGTERPIQRPVDRDEQEEYSSGKQKCHTVKHILLIDARCCIQFLRATYAGKWHDTSLVDAEPYRLPAGSSLYQDRGFQGLTVACVAMEQPTKKPRGGSLTAAQKAENHRIASEKMRIEHMMSSVKRCRIVKDTMRYWQDQIRDLVMAIACGLHNLRLRHRPWNYGDL